uniref:Uncharacterized protein n=1 Tax=Panagrolaimus sp. JU765 TaxID=591449 RepID=A0AC34Q119_9BILA
MIFIKQFEKSKSKMSNKKQVRFEKSAEIEEKHRKNRQNIFDHRREIFKCDSERNFEQLNEELENLTLRSTPIVPLIPVLQPLKIKPPTLPRTSLKR